MDHYEAMLTRGGVREICAFMRSDDKPYVDNRPFQEQENSAHDELCGRLNRYRFDKETLDDILSAVYIYSDTIEAIHREIGFRAGMRPAAQLGVGISRQAAAPDRRKRAFGAEDEPSAGAERQLHPEHPQRRRTAVDADVSENLRLSPHNAGDVLERRRGCGRRSGAKAAQAGRAADRGFVGAR